MSTPALRARPRLRLLRVAALRCVLAAVAWCGLAMIASSAQAVARSRALEPEDAPVRRFALLVGANDGGSDRVRLRYANSDADAMADVLRELGGVGATELVQLRDPTPADLDAAFDDLARELRAAASSGARTQLLFYYSGHSDERGILLGAEQVSYATLRKRVQSVPADVRIAILDSCASGAFTQLKGGTRRTPFLVGSGGTVEGHAFLTSSSADEAAQESDRVGGSFFTHYLESGLRGAADVDGDRFVTLTEAYRFAFDSTLARTESTRGGAQHAAYDIQLAGSGDLVMTDLRRPSATLVIGVQLIGRVTIRGTSGRLAAEIDQAVRPSDVSLALEPGKYQVFVDDGASRRKATVELVRGGTTNIATRELVLVPVEHATLRGGAYAEVPFDIGLLPPASVNGARARKLRDPDVRVRNRASLSFGWNRAARVDGISLGFGASIIDEELHGVQGSMGASLVRGSVEGWQFAQVFARAREVVGVQSAMITHADTIERGAQLAVVAAATSVRGAQVGFVDVAREVHGAQVGLFAYARQADAQVALIGITREGGVHPEVWTSDNAAFNLGLRLPAKRTYSMVNIGVHPFGTGASWHFGLGFGGHIALGRKAFTDIDLASYVVLDGVASPRGPAALAQLRWLFGWQPLPRLALFGGPTLNVLFDRKTQTFDRPGYGWTVVERIEGGSRIRVWPGFAAGLRF
jgi:hypothetical protein